MTLLTYSEASLNTYVSVPEFTYNLTLPCYKDTVRVRELPNSLYKNILKYIQGKDKAEISRYFMEVVSYLCIDVSIEELNKIDMLYILLFIRYACISPDVKFEFKCEKTGNPYSGSVDVSRMLGELETKSYPETIMIDLEHNIHVTLGIPKDLYRTESLGDTICSCITEVTLDTGVYFDLTGFTLEQKKEITDRLPGDVMVQTLEYLLNGTNEFEDILVLTNKSPHDPEASPVEVKLGLFDSTMMEFIEVLYTDNLQNYFYTLYILVSKIHMDSTLVSNMSPVECNVIMRRYIEEVEKRNEDIKKQNSKQSTPIPGAPMNMDPFG